MNKLKSKIIASAIAGVMGLISVSSPVWATDAAPKTQITFSANQNSGSITFTEGENFPLGGLWDDFADL